MEGGTTLADTEVRYVEHPAANLSGMISAVNEMQNQVNNLGNEVLTVSGRVDSINSQFQDFMQDFRRFVEQDLKDRRLQEALSDRVALRQELETRFARHKQVRRYVTGILQATDVSLVRKDTIQNCTEELMVAIPHYWLAPALIALSAWINNNAPLTEKALREAMNRDDEKTSLMFCLICRRAGRNQASYQWLYRYFAMQDPTSVERKLVVVLDAYANGLFGADSRNLCSGQIGAWIGELEDTVGFREAQVERWQNAIMGKMRKENKTEQYPYLAKYCTNWSDVSDTLDRSRLHGIMYGYLQDLFAQPAGNLGELKAQLDALLNSLVGNYDAEELPLQERLRMADLIVECKGDEPEAARRFAAEKPSFDEHSDLTELLTNAAMNPELVHASPATQKLSLAISRDWLIEAYENVTVQNRNEIVGALQFDIEGFKCETDQGDNEEELIDKATAHFERVRDEKISSVKQSPIDYFLLAAAAVVLVLSFTGSLPIPVGLVAVIFAGIKFFLGRRKVQSDIEGLMRDYADIIQRAGEVIRALCAETVDVRQEIARLEGDYEPLMAYMKQIAPEQFIATNSQRNVIIA